MTIQQSLKIKTNYRNLDRAQMLSALAMLRKQCQEIVKGESLLEVASPIGLLLADVAEKLELTTQERRKFLGEKLQKEVDAYLNTHVKRKLPL